MKIPRAALAFVGAIITASCSEKAPPAREQVTSEARRDAVDASHAEDTGREEEQRPEEDQVAEQCVAFVRSTKVVPAAAASTGCPGCPARGPDVLSFRQMKTEAISCSGDTCKYLVTIRAVFNPGRGESMAGGLTAWISPEQRRAYLNGETPEGEHEFRIQITYKRDGAAWRVVEFERPAGE